MLVMPCRCEAVGCFYWINADTGRALPLALDLVVKWR